ncbi:hypothetical protein VPH35_038484 [Triticum aestivum]
MLGGGCAAAWSGPGLLDPASDPVRGVSMLPLAVAWCLASPCSGRVLVAPWPVSSGMFQSAWWWRLGLSRAACSSPHGRWRWTWQGGSGSAWTAGHGRHQVRRG